MHATVFLRTLRLATGLVLMAFVTSHLANLSIGLVSLSAMEDWLGTLMAPWQTPIGRFLLAGSALVHAVLGLYAMAMRRTLVMKKTDWVQLMLGVLTPPLLLNHVLVTAIAPKLAADYEPGYGQMLSVYWSIAPAYAFQQLCVVLVVWVHAALGLYSWLVLKPVWRRISGFVLPVLFLVPIVALMGFAEAGKEVIEKLAGDAAWRDLILQNQARLGEARAQLAALNAMLVRVYGAVVLLALAVFAGRILRNRLTRVSVAYDAGFSAGGRRGLSILELSRLNNVPHADVCSGRGRCGTCRVHVTSGEASLSPRTPIEARTLGRVQAAPGDRLACQARVLGTGVQVVRALPAYADASAARQPDDWAEDAPTPPVGASS